MDVLMIRREELLRALDEIEASLVDPTPEIYPGITCGWKLGHLADRLEETVGDEVSDPSRRSVDDLHRLSLWAQTMEDRTDLRTVIDCARAAIDSAFRHERKRFRAHQA